MRVLVVVDDHPVRQRLTESISAWGHEVCVACDGPTTLLVGVAFRPHAVLFACGWEVARQLRREAGRPVLLIGLGCGDAELVFCLPEGPAPASLGWLLALAEGVYGAERPRVG